MTYEETKLSVIIVNYNVKYFLGAMPLFCPCRRNGDGRRGVRGG